MVFFRSVSFSELESLVDYIYQGRTQVAGSSVQAFLSLANSLGVSGFTEEEEENYKENIQLSSNSTVTTPLCKVSWSSSPAYLHLKINKYNNSCIGIHLVKSESFIVLHSISGNQISISNPCSLI